MGAILGGVILGFIVSFNLCDHLLLFVVSSASESCLRNCNGSACLAYGRQGRIAYGRLAYNWVLA